MGPKIRIFITGIVIITLLPILAANTQARWGVEIESKEVAAGATGVTIGIRVFWDLPMQNFVLPLVAREIDGGAFWTGRLPCDTGGNGYAKPHLHGIEWNWAQPWASLVEEFRPATPVIAGLNVACDPPADAAYNGISPDHFVIFAGAAGSYTPAEPDGRVVLTMTFDVKDAGGQFVFDTACFTRSLFTIFMIDNQFPPVNHGHTLSGTSEITFQPGRIAIMKDAMGGGAND